MRKRFNIYGDFNTRKISAFVNPELFVELQPFSSILLLTFFPQVLGNVHFKINLEEWCLLQKHRQ